MRNCQYIYLLSFFSPFLLAFPLLNILLTVPTLYFILIFFCIISFSVSSLAASCTLKYQIPPYPPTSPLHVNHSKMPFLHVGLTNGSNLTRQQSAKWHHHKRTEGLRYPTTTTYLHQERSLFHKSHRDLSTASLFFFLTTSTSTFSY